MRGVAQSDEQLLWMDDGNISIVEVHHLNKDYVYASYLSVESAEFVFDDEVEELRCHAMYGEALLGGDDEALVQSLLSGS